MSAKLFFISKLVKRGKISEIQQIFYSEVGTDKQKGQEDKCPSKRETGELKILKKYIMIRGKLLLNHEPGF